tara:strand:+ start:214 stop:816 length:603 start_codon:yes stop_codon:yes gene_type:complete
MSFGITFAPPPARTAAWQLVLTEITLRQGLGYTAARPDHNTAASVISGGLQQNKETRSMPLPSAPRHKNKTLTTFLATVFGSIGLHRFYLHGGRDRFGWLHILAIPLSLALMAAQPDAPKLFTGLPFVLSALIACLEALVLGLTPDDKWDARYNTGSGKNSESHWILALILVLTVGLGAMGVIALLARSFDLLFTGGAFG